MEWSPSKNPFRVTPPSVNDVVDQRKSLCKTKSSPVEVTLLCSDWFNFVTMEFARQLARFSQIKVTVLVPECNLLGLNLAECNLLGLNLLKEYSEGYGYRMVEAKKRPGFDDPIDWLMSPPEGFRTDIVFGIGRKLGKIAQLWKEHYQCKNIYIEELLIGVGYVEPVGNTIANSLLEIMMAADVAMAIGSKICDELSRDLCYSKPVFNLTPGIFSDFSNVSHGDGNATERKFHVLFLGSDDPNCFEKEGFDIAAKAVAQNGKSYRLTYVGAGRKRSQLTKKFRLCGVAETQLDFQSLPRGIEDWKRLLSRVDLAIMPSGLKAFGLEALFALSAGLPVLVHAESGFGEALKEVKFGTSAIVDSDDFAVWAKKIRKVRETDKKTRLEQATVLRACYDEKYSWEKQCGELVNRMVKMVPA